MCVDGADPIKDVVEGGGGGGPTAGAVMGIGPGGGPWCVGGADIAVLELERVATL